MSGYRVPDPSRRLAIRARDMMRLADEYLRRRTSDPSITLENFAAECGVSPDDLQPHLPELDEDSVILWHGTSQSRVKSILREGFRAEEAERWEGREPKIYFTLRLNVARQYARTKAKADHDRLAILMCSIDLNRYTKFERVGAEVYALSHERIGPEVIREVQGLPKRVIRKWERRGVIGSRDTNVEHTDVALVLNTGRAGIAYWINNYLKLDDESRINEDHNAVGKLKEWFDAQMDEGRFGEVPDEEILAQLRKYMPQHWDDRC